MASFNTKYCGETLIRASAFSSVVLGKIRELPHLFGLTGELSRKKTGTL